ncbi:MAG TPA: hypothetical protein VNQ76_03760 [Planctomicrobium sp.]|nr:hypothetical protein [Planctomicrobium sp.]
MRHRFLLLVAMTGLMTGCTMMQHAAPHQLWKLNRQKAPTSESADGYFSLPATPLSHQPGG